MSVKRVNVIFYRFFNSIFREVGCIAFWEVVLQLVLSKYVPFVLLGSLLFVFCRRYRTRQTSDLTIISIKLLLSKSYGVIRISTILGVKPIKETFYPEKLDFCLDFTYMHIRPTWKKITLHCIALQCISCRLHCIALRYTARYCIALHGITLRYITLRYITLRYFTLRYIKLRYIKANVTIAIK